MMIMCTLRGPTLIDLERPFEGIVRYERLFLTQVIIRGWAHARRHPECRCIQAAWAAAPTHATKNVASVRHRAKALAMTKGPSRRRTSVPSKAPPERWQCAHGAWRACAAAAMRMPSRARALACHASRARRALDARTVRACLDATRPSARRRARNSRARR